MFENEYIFDKDLIKEYVFNVMGKMPMLRSLFLFILGLILYFIVEENMKYLMLACSFVGIFCVVAFPIVMINNLEKAGKRLHNGHFEKTFVTFGDNIIMNEGKVHLEFEYNQIVKIHQTKRLIILSFSDNAGIIVSKEGFTKGTLEEFLPFIKEKTNI